MLPPLEVLIARRRLWSKLPEVRAAGAGWRSGSALRFKGLADAAGLDTPLVCAAGFRTAEPVDLLARANCEIKGEDEDELEELLWLSERLRPGPSSEALVGGEDPRGEGFCGDVESREADFLEALVLDSSLGTGASDLGTLEVGVEVDDSAGRLRGA